MKAGTETALYNQGYMDGFDDAVKSEIEKIKPKLKDVKEKAFPKDDLDYWTRLEHQYAGMAMQGMIRTIGHDRMYPPEKIAIYAEACAHALVKKMKEEKK
jgi:hypothetical protein